MSMEEEWSIQGIEKIQPTAIKQIQSIVAKNRIGHAYIIEGANGTGKTKVMQFFVQLMFCENSTENVPCETCRNCKRLKSALLFTSISILCIIYKEK